MRASSSMPDFIVPRAGALLDVVRSQWRDLARAAASTTLTALAGFTAALVFGMTIGLLIHESRPARGVLLPAPVALKSTPVVALVPVVTLLIGIGFRAKLLFAFVVCFFPMVLSTYVGLRDVPAALNEFAFACMKSRMRYFLHVMLPSATDQLVLGMKITMPLAYVGAVVAEMSGGDDSGLGYMIVIANNRLNIPLLYVAVALLMAVSATAYYVLTWGTGLFNPRWRRGEGE